MVSAFFIDCRPSTGTVIAPLLFDRLARGAPRGAFADVLILLAADAPARRSMVRYVEKPLPGRSVRRHVRPADAAALVTA